MMTEFLVLLNREKPVFHGIRSSLNLNHRRVSVKFRESSRVKSRGADHQPEVFPFLQNPVEITEQEINVKRTLMRLIDDQGVILSKQAIPLRFCEKDAIRHELYLCVLTDLFGKPDLIANKAPFSLSHFFCNPAGNTGSCQSTRLRTPDPPRPSSRMTLRGLPNQLKSHFRKLSRLSATCLPDNNHNPARAHRLENLIPLSGNW